MALLIAYLIAGVYVAVLGYIYDPPPSETDQFTPLGQVLFDLIHIFGFVLLSLIWPWCIWEMARKYPGRKY